MPHDLSEYGPEVQRRALRLAREVQQPKYASQSSAQVAATLNARIDYTACAPFGPSELKSLLSAEHLDAVVSLPSFDSRMLPLLEGPDPKTPATLQKIGLWLGTLVACGRISAAEFSACASLLGSTATYHDGPSIGESLGCPAVQDFEVELARSVV